MEKRVYPRVSGFAYDAAMTKKKAPASPKKKAAPKLKTKPTT
jgi:hypothetical protein